MLPVGLRTGAVGGSGFLTRVDTLIDAAFEYPSALNTVTVMVAEPPEGTDTSFCVAPGLTGYGRESTDTVPFAQPEEWWDPSFHVTLKLVVPSPVPPTTIAFRSRGGSGALGRVTRVETAAERLLFVSIATTETVYDSPGVSPLLVYQVGEAGTCSVPPPLPVTATS